MIHCQHCGAESTNGLALCDLCRRKATTVLEFLPTYYRNLSRWRPGRAGARPVPGSRVLYDGTVRGTGTGDRISDALDETFNMLGGWARVLVKDRPGLARLHDRLVASRSAESITEAQAVAWLCAGFDKWLTSVATTDWCGEFLRDLDAHETRLRAFTERFVPGWYAGGCRQVVAFDGDGAAVRCESGTYVVPGLTWVTCAACGTTTYARDHLEVVLHEARGWVAPPMRVAEAVVALIDTELSVPRLHKRISKWGERWPEAGIEPLRRKDRDGDDSGPKRYRLGDVLDRLLAEGATRIEAKRRNVA